MDHFHNPKVVLFLLGFRIIAVQINSGKLINVMMAALLCYCVLSLMCGGVSEDKSVTVL